MNIPKPSPLSKGDRIAIAATSGHVDKMHFLEGASFLESKGYKVSYNDSIFSTHRYLAGDDNRRADELNAIIADPSISAIFFARGGYGIQRILPLIDISPLYDHPKWIVGYSDITPLFSMLNAHAIGGTIYGPTVAKHFNSTTPAITWDYLESLLKGNLNGVIPTSNCRVLKTGSATGTLTGGCLTLLSTSVHTNYDLPKYPSILFFEEVNESLYRIDRMLTHLKHSETLKYVTGILIGDIKLPSTEHTDELDTLILEVLEGFPGPIIAGIQTGHMPFELPFYSLPLGATCEMTTAPIAITWS